MADITKRGQLERDDSGYPAGWNYSYITATGATIVKGSAGIFHNIIINKPINGIVITLNDSTSALTGTYGQITLTSSTIPTFLNYDATMNNGLVVNVTGTNSAVDITVTYV